MNKSDLRKHADALSSGAIDCIRSVLVKHNMGIIEGAAESVEAAHAAGKLEAAQHILDMWKEQMAHKTCFQTRLIVYVEELK